MGVPLKVSAEGKTFFLCCKGCNKELKANPQAVVAKLGK
jgi:YHS domain-containing protein